jgi:hypothetical protein
MKKILLIVLAIFPFLSNAQNINYNNGNCISGDCENGYGVYEYDNGDKYSGTFSNGQFNGQGKFIHKSGAYYDGIWNNNMKNGQGIYVYSQNNDKLKYEGTFSDDKFNGYGVLTYKDGKVNDGIWKDNVFLGTKIGVYQNQDVLKKEDTVAVIANNSKYLLSEQAIMSKQGFASELNENIPNGSFIIETDLQGKKSAIGYVTTTGKMPNSTFLGEIKEYVKNATGCKFFEKKIIAKPQGEPIGKYNNETVYRSKDSIIMGDKAYLLFLQPKQNSFNLINVVPGLGLKYLNVKTRYFIMYSGKTVPSETDFRNENLIGYVDYDKNTYIFTQRKGNRIEGVNLFGSLYIGPNNPTYPNGKPIKTLPAQDNVDAAALEHDNCYEGKNAAGASDAILNSGIVDCDMELVMRCLATLQIHVEDNPTQSAIDFIKNKLDWGKLLSIKDLKNHEQITDPIQRAKYTATFFLGTSSAKGLQLILKPIVKPVDDAVTNFGKREIDKNDLLQERDKKQTITYTAPVTLISTSGEQFEAAEGDTFEGIIKNGKAVQGRLYDKDGNVKKLIIPQRNN